MPQGTFSQGCAEYALPQRPLFGRFRAVWKGSLERICPRARSRRGCAEYALPQRPLFRIFRAVWKGCRSEYSIMDDAYGENALRIRYRRKYNFWRWHKDGRLWAS